MIQLSKRLRSVAVGLLLAGAFLCGGLKSPFIFSIWALVALLWAAYSIHGHPPDRRSTGYFLAFNAGVLLSQIYSLDPSNSFYWTVQSLVLACWWLVFREAAPFPEEQVFWFVLQVLAALTVLITSLQFLHGSLPYGFLPTNPNFNAVWMAAAAGAFLSKEKSPPYEKLMCLALALLVVIGKSRSGLLGLLAAIVYVLLQSRRQVTFPWVLGLASVLALLLPRSWWIQRIHWAEEGARLRIWGVAIKALAERPLTGYGLGNFELAYLRHAFPVEGAVRYSRTTAFAHNDYLQVLSEWGWPTAGLLLVGFINTLFTKPAQRPLAVAAKAMLMVLATAAFFNPVFKMPAFVVLAILLMMVLRPTLSDERRIETNWFVGYLVLIGLALAWCGRRSMWAEQNHWDKIVRWDRKDAEAWHELAKTTPDRTLALYAEQNAVEESPEQPYYIEALARELEISQVQEHRLDALAAYQAALLLSPTRVINHIAIARLLWREGDLASALTFADNALALEPHYWEALLWKARCLKALGQKAEASTTLLALQKRHADFENTPHVPPQSPYESAILGYSEEVVQKEIARAR